MQPRSTMPDARVLLPRCRCCAAPMRVRTIEVLDQREDIRLACTACGREMIHSCQLGNQPHSAVMG